MPSYSALGDSLFYEERGVGDPVVVLGGGPARHPDYLGDLGGLGRRFRLIVPHLRGVGQSPFPSDPSLGSWWSQAGFPGSLQRMVLVTPPGGDLVDVPSDIGAIRARRSNEPEYEAALTAARQGPPVDGDDDRLTAWQRAIAPVSYATWGAPQQEHATVGRWSAEAARAYNVVEVPESYRSDLASVQAPVRVIAAAEDGVTGAAAPVAIAGLFPDGRSVTVQGAGHYPWVDQPVEFISAAEAALRA
jgi:pimeloyl-ACP methyl ester carboxylesterase